MWWYQEVARRVGLDRMRELLASLDYGDARIGERVDTFWLEGPLTISAREQVTFLGRLTRGELPLSERSVSILRDVIPSETRGDAIVRSKTGTHGDEHGSHAWLVGWVERGGAETAWFALVLEGASYDDAGALRAARGPLAMELLAREGLVPPR